MHEGSSQLTRYQNLFRHVSNPWTYLGYKFSLRRASSLPFVLKGDIRIEVPKRRLPEFKMIVLDNCYLKGFRANTFHNTEQMTIMDVGANLGFFSLYAASRFPEAQIIAIEPLSGNFNYLQKNIQENPTVVTQIACIKAALCSQNGTVTLTESRHDEFPTGASIGNQDPQGIQFKVPAMRLSDVFSRHKLTEVSLLKLDCEGAEYDILYRSNPEDLKRIQNIAMEVHVCPGPDENRPALCTFLQEHGFSCCITKNPGFLWASRDKKNLVQCTNPAH